MKFIKAFFGDRPVDFAPPDTTAAGGFIDDNLSLGDRPVN